MTSAAVKSALVPPKKSARPKPKRAQPRSRVAAGNQKLRTFIDLFCGIGGFHIAAKAHGLKCVFASDIDTAACEVYHDNFGVMPDGDISAIHTNMIPDHDLLCAGFPCQPFSIIGKSRGFDDDRGTLFFEIVRVISAKLPAAFVLENVKQLATIDGGKVLGEILQALTAIGYEVDYRILNAIDFGLPQKRERIFIVGRFDGLHRFEWPSDKISMKPLSEVLELDPHERHYVSPRIREAEAESTHCKSITFYLA